jgi:hypothetical protein
MRRTRNGEKSRELCATWSPLDSPFNLWRFVAGVAKFAVATTVSVKLIVI